MGEKCARRPQEIWWRSGTESGSLDVDIEIPSVSCDQSSDTSRPLGLLAGQRVFDGHDAENLAPVARHRGGRYARTYTKALWRASRRRDAGHPASSTTAMVRRSRTSIGAPQRRSGTVFRLRCRRAADQRKGWSRTGAR